MSRKEVTKIGDNLTCRECIYYNEHENKCNHNTGCQTITYEYMVPNVEEAFFKSTNSNESADIDGISEMGIKAELSKDY